MIFSIKGKPTESTCLPMTNSTKERHERACFYFQYTVNDIFHQIVSQQGLANHGPTS